MKTFTKIEKTVEVVKVATVILKDGNSVGYEDVTNFEIIDGVLSISVPNGTAALEIYTHKVEDIEFARCDDVPKE